MFENKLLSMIKMERGLVAMASHDDEQQFTVPYNDLLNDSVNDSQKIFKYLILYILC